MRRWHPTTNRSTAILVPAAASGVIFLLSTGAFTLLESNAPKMFDSEAAAMVIPLSFLATIVGFILGLVPMFVGVSAMHWLGSWNLGLRHPAAWGLAGGGMAAAVVIAGSSGHFDTSGGFAPALVATGTLCALLARGYVRWPSEEEWQ
jgi:hypothetical protein